MSTDLFQALTLGLLVIVILALLVTVSMLGRIRAALEGRSPARAEPAAEDTDAPVRSELDAEPVHFDTPVQDDLAASVYEPAEASATGADEPVSTVASEEEDSERPFERGGRWYFRRGGELLVYEEGTGEWVPAPGGQDAGPAVASHAEAVAASSEPATVELEETGPAAVPAGAEAARGSAEPTAAESLEPSTSFAGQPLASAEEDVATLGDADAVDEGDEAVVATGFEEPGGGEVDLEEAPEEVAARPSESFWRCGSCGAVNGSTATSCRMCFAPKP